MKQQSDNSKVYLDQDELDQLLTEVKETVASDISNETNNEQIFSAADLWRIQRMKSRVYRRSTLWN